jgi:biopolymer transport protein ExbD
MFSRNSGSDQLPRVIQNVLAVNPDVEIYVQGDRRLRFKDVRRVLLEAHRAGAKRLALAAAKDGDGR